MSKSIKRERAHRTIAAARQFSEAARVAEEHGLRLVWCASSHYQIRGSDWILDFWPGTGRVRADPKHPGPSVESRVWQLAELVSEVSCVADTYIPPRVSTATKEKRTRRTRHGGAEHTASTIERLARAAVFAYGSDGEGWAIRQLAQALGMQVRDS